MTEGDRALESVRRLTCNWGREQAEHDCDDEVVEVHSRAPCPRHCTKKTNASNKFYVQGKSTTAEISPN